jgi:transcription initiation factor TFIID subunit 8
MTCNGSEPATINLGNSSKGKRARECNPFLVLPQQFGEKEVSSIVLPAKLSNETFLHHLNRAIVGKKNKK